MRYVTIGRFQFSAVFLLIVAISSPLAFAATYYIFSSKTVTFSVEEPLSVIEFPTSIHFHPGENSTTNIAIANSATTTYEVRLVITFSDADYQQSNVQVSNHTYTIIPGNNTISAWIAVSKDAPPSEQQITVDFLRL
jgi:uncharacterized membrane protein